MASERPDSAPAPSRHSANDIATAEPPGRQRQRSIGRRRLVTRAATGLATLGALVSGAGAVITATRPAAAQEPATGHQQHGATGGQPAPLPPPGIPPGRRSSNTTTACR
jgi:hypothetical protein